MATGIPALQTAANVTNDIALVVADAEIVLNMFAGPTWGVFLNGLQALVPDSIAAVEFKADSRISDYQQEEGAFQTYNKVRTPNDIRVTVTKGGASSARTTFLSAVDAAYKSLNLYDVLTPDAIYTSMNIDHYDYRRTEKNGAGLLTVELWMTEVRVTATSTFSNTQAASGADASSTGNVQTVPLTQAQQAAIFNAPTGTTLTFPAQ